MAASLLAGTEILPVYDRSRLIGAAIGTLTRTLVEESAIVVLVCVVFFMHRLVDRADAGRDPGDLRPRRRPRPSGGRVEFDDP